MYASHPCCTQALSAWLLWLFQVDPGRKATADDVIYLHMIRHSCDGSALEQPSQVLSKPTANKCLEAAESIRVRLCGRVRSRTWRRTERPRLVAATSREVTPGGPGVYYTARSVAHMAQGGNGPSHTVVCAYWRHVQHYGPVCTGLISVLPLGSSLISVLAFGASFISVLTLGSSLRVSVLTPLRGSG